MRVFLNLKAGLDELGVGYRINDYRHIRSHPDEIACIVGKPHVLDKIKGRNPILFGAAVHSHPFQDPDLLRRLPIKRVLVPGEWMREMWAPYYGHAVIAWPVGIDTRFWKPAGKTVKEWDFLIYDKIRWNHDQLESSLLQPIRKELETRCLSYREMRYGFYQEEEFRVLLDSCKAMIFLCEHETQGIAYQQALACGVPLLAWDKGGICRDPYLLRHGVRFEPVTSVPYWDSRCGSKFGTIAQFPRALTDFWNRFQTQEFSPRAYIEENLTLKKCAKQYLDIVGSLDTGEQ